MRPSRETTSRRYRFPRYRPPGRLRRRPSGALVFAAALALGAIGAAACTGAGDGTASAGSVRGVTDDEIVIGTWAPLTGPAALWGSVGRGVVAHFAMINEAGGIHGRKVRVILRDDGYQPSRTVAAVKEMVERDGVFAFTGGVGTAPGMAVKDYIIDNEVVWVSPSTGATHWAYPPSRYIFATYTPYFDEAVILIDHAVNELGLTKIAVAYQNDDFGLSGVVGARMALEKHGLSLVETVSVEVMDTDLSSHALRLRESGAEAVLIWITPKHGAILLPAAAKIGFRPQWLSSAVLADMKQMHEITDGLWAGAIFANIGELPMGGHPQVAKYQEFIAGYSPDDVDSTFFLAGFLFSEPLVEALRRAGPDLTTDSLIAALESLDGYQGTGAPIGFGPGKRQGIRAVFLARCIDAANYERLTDWVEAGVDIDEAIRRLEAGE